MTICSRTSSRQAIDAQVRDLGGFARRLAAIDPAAPDRRPSGSSGRRSRRSIRARLFELEEVRTWERNPQSYADILATSLAGQALFDYAPLAERARRVLSKLRQVPRLMQAARDNIKDPPGIFVKVGLESMRGTLRFIDEDLPRAFATLDDLHLLGDLADASTEASTAIGALRRVSREGPRAAQQGLVPARARAVRAEAAARRGHRRSAPTGCSPSRCASCRRRRRSSAASPRG